MIETSLRARLKANTSRLHFRAESALESGAEIETTSGLSHFLHCMQAAQNKYRLECTRASRLAYLSPNSDRLLNALTEDLKRAGSTNNVRQHNKALAQARLDDGFCMGVGYVFEGSALGAGILRKRLKKAGMEIPQYLVLVSSCASSRWPKYVKALERCDYDEKTVTSGAFAVFETIISKAERSHVECLTSSTTDE